MPIGPLIDKFMLYLEYEKNASPRTIRNYHLRLTRLADFVGHEKPIADIKSMELLDYRVHLQQKHLIKKTINYHIVAIRSFLKFLHKNDIDCINPEKLELAKTPPRDVQFLSQDEVERLLVAPREFCQDTVICARDLAILSFLFSTGLRVSELCALQHEQIYEDTNQIRVIGKGRKLRSVFLTHDARDLLVAYKQCRTDTSAFVFVSYANNSF